MDFKEYDKVYQDLLNERGRIDIANDGKEKDAFSKSRFLDALAKIQQ